MKIYLLMYSNDPDNDAPDSSVEVIEAYSDCTKAKAELQKRNTWWYSPYSIQEIDLV